MNWINASQSKSQTTDPADVPLPVVTFTRWVYLALALGAYLLQQPLLLTVLLALVLPSVVLGKRYNVLGTLGRQIYRTSLADAPREDRRLIHFNNFLVVSFLLLAHVAFALNAATIAWVFALFIVVATGLALAGFCVGCVFFFALKIDRLNVFGKGW
jgi:hypothetical protein